MNVYEPKNDLRSAYNWGIRALGTGLFAAMALIRIWLGHVHVYAYHKEFHPYGTLAMLTFFGFLMAKHSLSKYWDGPKCKLPKIALFLNLIVGMAAASYFFS